jgi:ribosomal protein S18 acetylase RimI-like enzyme
MHIRRVRANEDSMRRYMEELWVPYCRELAEIVESEGLSEEFEIEDEIDWQLDQYDSATNSLWVALDDVAEPTARLSEIDASFVGFISTAVETAPEAFDWPDRVVIGDFYVRESYRGTGLADDLIARAVQVAREDGCSELALDVDVDNERALAYYEQLGFDVARHRMRVAVHELDV